LHEFCKYKDSGRRSGSSVRQGALTQSRADRQHSIRRRRGCVTYAQTAHAPTTAGKMKAVSNQPTVLSNRSARLRRYTER